MKYFAGHCSYGIRFEDDSRWMVHVFNSEKERDAWIKADPMDRPTRGVISSKDADRISPVANEERAYDGRFYHEGDRVYDNLGEEYCDGFDQENEKEFTKDGTNGS